MDFTPAAAPAAPAPSAPTSTPSSSGSSTPSTSTPARSSMTPSQFRNSLTNGRTAPAVPADDAAPDVDTSEDLSTSGTSVPDPVELDAAPDVEDVSDAPEEDESWLQDLKEYKEVHGISSKELLAALRNGEIPQSLFDKLSLELKDGDQVWRANLNEYRESAMRSEKFTKKTQELAQLRKAFEKEAGDFRTEREQIVHMFQHWQGDTTGIGLLRGLQKMGFPVDAMARAYAGELEQMESLPPVAQEALKARQLAEQELHALKQQQAYWQQQHEARTQAESQQAIQAQQNQNVQYVQAHAQKYFAEADLPITAGAWNLFNTHLQPLWEEYGLSPETIREAIQATKSDIAQRVAGHHGAASSPSARVAPTPSAGNRAPAQVAPQPIARRADPAAPTRPNPNAGPKRVTPAEFRKKLGM